jgi:hypothetical protein
MGWKRVTRGSLVAAASAALVLLAMGMPASASAADTPPPNTIGSFPTWQLAKSGATYTGSADFAAAAAFPATTLTSNATTIKAPSGESAFLGASTGFGQYFGSSRLQPYLNISPTGTNPSTTTLTFAGPPPAGWGFALGDIDADFVEIIAKDAGGTVLPGSDLGAQDTGGTPLLNYCNNSPKPSGCTGPGPFIDAPFWFPTGTTIAGTTYTTPIVKGNVLDTSGAYDWFQPGTDVRSLTFVYHIQSGLPIYQVWLAALAPVATITGTVTPPHGDTVPAGTTANLEQSNGTPVLNITDDPVTAPVAPDGTFTIDTEQAHYDIAFTVPPGFDPIPTIAVDATSAAVTLPPVALAPAAATPPADPTGPTLATTGVDSSPLVVGAGLALVGGLALIGVGFARRRRT